VKGVAGALFTDLSLAVGFSLLASLLVATACGGEIEILEAESRIQSRVRKQMGGDRKEYFLNEQKKAIQEELGEKDEFKNELDEFEARLRKKKMSKEAEDGYLYDVSVRIHEVMKREKNLKLKIGMLAGLQTFGGDMKAHIHKHCIISALRIAA